MMAPPKQFDEVLKEGKVAAAYAYRQEALGSLKLSVDKIDKAKADVSLSISRYQRLKSEAEVKIGKLNDL